jgi:hypothetical protein
MMSNRRNRTRLGHRSGLSRPDFGREDEFFVAGDPGRVQGGRDEELLERGRDRTTWFDDDDYGAADQSGMLAMIKNHSERAFFLRRIAAFGARNDLQREFGEEHVGDNVVSFSTLTRRSSSSSWTNRIGVAYSPRNL